MMMHPHICASSCVFPEIFSGLECLWPGTRRKSWPVFSQWGTTSMTSLLLNPCNHTGEWYSMKYLASVQSERAGCHLYISVLPSYTSDCCARRSKPPLNVLNNHCGHLCVCMASAVTRSLLQSLERLVSYHLPNPLDLASQIDLN